jgi:hypothetical protein
MSEQEDTSLQDQGIAVRDQLVAICDDWAAAIVSNAILYAFIGALAGWYGGYLRRRLAAPRTDQRRR